MAEWVASLEDPVFWWWCEKLGEARANDSCLDEESSEEMDCSKMEVSDDDQSTPSAKKAKHAPGSNKKNIYDNQWLREGRVCFTHFTYLSGEDGPIITLDL